MKQLTFMQAYERLGRASDRHKGLALSGLAVMSSGLVRRIGMVLAGLLLGSGWLVTIAHAEPDPGRPLQVARRIPSGAPPIVLDGRLDDAAWHLTAATATSAFTQHSPDPGRPPVESTTLHVLYDDEALYFGFDCIQERAPVVARLTRRDRQVESDSVSVSLDTHHNGQSAFEFMVSAASVLVDTLHFNDTESSDSWDENWEGRATRTPHGWSAELRIPLRILRFDGLPQQSWGFQARRYVSVRKETDEWAFIAPAAAGEVSLYGKLVGLDNLKPRRSLGIRAIVVGRVRHRDPAPEYARSGTDLSASAGLDLKWNPTQNLTLDGTLNPDFSQVEADQVLLNLSSFEIFFPEKRPFFLESSDTFSTPLSVLYTRRIGLAPALPKLWLGEQPLAPQEPTMIYGAAKLTGTLGRRVTIGLLTALSGRNSTQVLLPDKSQTERLAEPLTLWSTLRLRFQPRSNLQLGVISTLTLRFEPDQYPQGPDGSGGLSWLCPGGERLVGSGPARCFHDAFVGGFDWRWRSEGGYVIDGQAVLSAIMQGPPRVLADGTRIESGDASSGVHLRLAKESGNFIGQIAFDGLGRKLDYNDLGYLQRQNQVAASLRVGYRTTEPFGAVLESNTRLEIAVRDNLDWLNIGRELHLKSWWRFRSFWELFFEFQYLPAYFDDREVGNGTALERTDRFGIELEVTSDSRKRASFRSWTQVQLLHEGLHVEGDAEITLRLRPQLDLQFLPLVLHAQGEPRYVAQAGQSCAENWIVAPPKNRCAELDALLFGRLTATSVGLTVRSTYTFTPRVTLQMYAQLLVAARRYADFSAPTLQRASGAGSPRVVHLDELQPAALPPFNPDQVETILNLNVTLRWEFLLGSTVYLVYTRSQAPQVSLLPNQPGSLDIGALRGGGTTDAFLIKFVYWTAT